MNFDFIPISLDLKNDYEAIRAKSPEKSADFTFTNVWGWASHYNLSVAFIENVAIIKQADPIQCYWAPIGDWNDFDFDILKHLPPLEKSYNPMDIEIGSPVEPRCLTPHGSLSIHRVPLSFAELAKERLADKVDIIETRGQWEYLYNKDDLKNLSGNRFHKKKNHVKNFYKLYGEDYIPLHCSEGKGSIEEVLLLQEEWCKWHDCEASPSLKAENDVISRIVGNWDKFDSLIGGSLYHEDKMVAFTLGEEVNPETLVVHFEKAHTNYKGSYQAINHAFINHLPKEYSLINREQDLDEEGLRQAKSSYHPIDYLKKSTLVLIK